MRLLIVPMAAMAETSGPFSRFKLLAESAVAAGIDAATCIAEDVNYSEINGIKNYFLDVPAPLGMPEIIASKLFPVAQKLGITSRKTVKSFDEVLWFTGNSVYSYLVKSVASVRRAIRNFKPDIVYSEFSISAMIAAKLENKKLFVTVSYPTQLEYANSPKLARGVNRYLKEKGLPQVNSVLELFDKADELVNKKTLFISYCWNDGGGYADELEKQLSESFDVKRDKSQIGLRDDIQEFMREIANCDSVILVLTEGYVVSENCMFEMAYLLEQVDWKEKAWFLVVHSSLYSIEKKIDIIKYWNNKQEMLSNHSDIKNETIIDYQKRDESINNTLPRFFDGLSRINNPSQISIVNSIIKYSEQNKNQSLKLISESERKVMEILNKYGNQKMSDIAQNTGLSNATIHRILGNMISEGKIVKSGNNFRTIYKLPEGD